MAAATPSRAHVAERLTAGTIGATWILWITGGLYFAGPVLGWALALLAVRAWYLAPVLPEAERPAHLPRSLWAWLIGMAVMLVVLLIGHADFGLGTAQTIKSAVGWAKGWALLALFPFAGFALPIRVETLSRAVCKLGLQTLILLPLFFAAPFVGLPQKLWVSPLAVLGGSGDEYFAAILYTIEPGVGTARWQFFAPWSPAAGMVAVIHFLLARMEPDAKWRWTGYTASILVALLSQSRLALIALAVIMPLAWLAGKVRGPALWLSTAALVLIGSWFSPQLQALVDKMSSDFSSARADSSRVRAALGRIAVQRWQSEAYWFGHGIVERGPHMVEYMPIGSHHTWYGLLFVKGLAGAMALAVPMMWMLVATFRAAMDSKVGRLGFAMALTYWLYSFGENLEVLTYIAWPALLAIGIALKPGPARAPEPPDTEPAAG